MMIVYLNKNLFKPATVFLSVVFAFLFLLFLILTLVTLQLMGVVALVVVAVAYGVALYLAYESSRSKKYYLKEQSGYLEIKYPKISFERGQVKIPYQAIAGFTYYTMNSWEGWAHFLNTSALPGCVYISYVNKYGKMVTELMGHVEQSLAEKLAKRYGVGIKIV